METVRFTSHKMDLEKMVIRMAMALLEAFGMVMLICGLFEIQIF